VVLETERFIMPAHQMRSGLAESVCALPPQLTAIRHNIHAHPELGFHEKRTAALVTGLRPIATLMLRRG
jgi:hippurate hydrolase